jgi:hypothetical protein
MAAFISEIIVIERDSKPFSLGIKRKIFLIGLAMVVVSFYALAIISSQDDQNSCAD